MKPAGPGGAPAAEGGVGDGQAPGLPPLSSPPAGPAWEQVVHSRSQALFRGGSSSSSSSGGSPVLGDALKLLVPRSTAFMSSEAELWDFLCSLRHEFSPVILRSKDVYGYASCRAVVPDWPRGWPQDEEDDEEEAAGTSRRSRRGGGGKAPAAAAANKRKRPPADAKSRRGGRSAKPAAKKPKEDGLIPPRKLWACEKRPVPARRTPSDPEPLPDPPIPAEIPLSAFPPIKVRGDIWERRSLETARRRAQRLWRVDLAPVVKLRRIPTSWWEKTA
ncbi:coiled-coil domain-containing protein 71L [Thamnophis elegans]|uniref:coiled-coil domain-containing protein 71L n=1 Tax=Thamnophis elegans TaxID=35005 RepID=UPI001378763F|nr:coiled-coil domain-containing protein 71L [Thamnophis elegans]